MNYPAASCGVSTEHCNSYGYIGSYQPVYRSKLRGINPQRFNEVGIPAATFGMPRKSAPDAEERFVEVKDLVDAAKMYALVALEICGR